MTVGAIMTSWQYFPKSRELPELLGSVVDAVRTHEPEIDSEHHDLRSDAVLALLRPDLEGLGFQVEVSKRAGDKIRVPVLFGRDGRLEKYFEADAHHVDAGVVMEVEAGRAYVNNQFLKDLFQACVMHDVDELVIAVRRIYNGGADFERIVGFFETLYASDRLKLPLSGVLVIGY